jgi:hypothetical protein
MESEREVDLKRDHIMLDVEAIHFDPDDFQKKFKPLKLERFFLSSEQLYMNAIRVIEIRSDLLRRSKAIDDWAQRQAEALDVVRKST